MSNIIAIIWDCDKTLINGYMQDPIFDMYAEADYSEGTTANLWIKNKIFEIADRIRSRERSRLINAISSVPKHLV